MDDAATGGGVSFSGFLTADQHQVRDAFVAAIRDECASQTAEAIVRLADERVRHQAPVRAPVAYTDSRPISREELAESLLFYRRRLTEKLTLELVRLGHGGIYGDGVPKMAEDMANAICERLAARETGDAHGYKQSG